MYLSLKILNCCVGYSHSLLGSLFSWKAASLTPSPQKHGNLNGRQHPLLKKRQKKKSRTKDINCCLWPTTKLYWSHLHTASLHGNTKTEIILLPTFWGVSKSAGLAVRISFSSNSRMNFCPYKDWLLFTQTATHTYLHHLQQAQNNFKYVYRGFPQKWNDDP